MHEKIISAGTKWYSANCRNDIENENIYKMWATVLLAYVKKQIQSVKKVSFTACSGYM